MAGPAATPWKGRNKPRRQDRRWATAWSPEQISNRLKLVSAASRLGNEHVPTLEPRPGSIVSLADGSRARPIDLTFVESALTNAPGGGCSPRFGVLVSGYSVL